MQLLEYRGNLLIWVVLESFWVLWQLLLIDVLFKYTDTIAGWNKSDVFVLVAMFKIVKGFFDIFFYSNLLSFPQTINKGEFDYVLTKPIDSQFLISLRTQQFIDFGEVAFGISILCFIYQQSGFNLSFASVVGSILAGFLGITIIYSVTVPASLLAIFFSRMSALWTYHDLLKNLIRYPSDIFTLQKSPVAIGVFFFLAFIITVPAKLLLGKADLSVLPGAIIVTGVLFCTSRWLWTKSLRYYSSASS